MEKRAGGFPRRLWSSVTVERRDDLGGPKRAGREEKKRGKTEGRKKRKKGEMRRNWKQKEGVGAG